MGTAVNKTPGSLRIGRFVAVTALLALSFYAGGAVPTTWRSVGTGGGGALFAPSFSPHNAGELYAACDMSGLYHTTNFGSSWSLMSFRQIEGNRHCFVRFTSDPNVLYALNFKPSGFSDAITPSKSIDGGATWTAITDPTDGAYDLFADCGSTTRLIINSWGQLYFSSDGGTTWNLRYTCADNGAGLYIAGVFFDGSSIYVGTNDGLLVSTNGGASFTLSTVTGIPTTKQIISFAGAKQGGTTRLFALVVDAGSLWNGITVEDFFWGHKDVYVLDWGGTWQLRSTGLPTADGDALAWIGCAQNNISTAYVAGQDSIENPLIYKTSNAGTSWTKSLFPTNNQNIATGWSGDKGDRQWSYGAGATGFSVAPNDANKAAWTDYGFLHLTTDGGTSWRQAYVNPADQNPANALTPQRRYYRGVGLEVTSAWWLTWAGTNNIFASCTDIRGERSTDGGNSWSFDYSGHTENTAYQVLKHPTSGTLYMATSSVHDMYESTYLQDTRIDGGTGRVLFSTDGGATWQLLHDFGHPVIFLALDPNNGNRMLASVIDSAAGGIFATSNLQAGAASTWAKLTNPPRTEGHPYNVRVLNDGTLVCSYSGRRNTSGTFTASSGVFVSTNGGTSWIDRSDTGMRYWTKDVIVDPYDSTQQRWYACVFSGWGGAPNGLGGIYRTANRGVTWTRITSGLDRVESLAISPTDPNEAYASTEVQGLWHTANLSATTPTFTQVASYPFGHPMRIFWNPGNSTELWVTSFGAGTMTGSTTQARVAEWQGYK